MTPLSIRLTEQDAVVECETCGRTLSLPTSDKVALVTEVRGFLSSHGDCPED
jgi:ribosomal protein S27E